MHPSHVRAAGWIPSEPGAAIERLTGGTTGRVLWLEKLGSLVGKTLDSSTKTPHLKKTKITVE